MHHETRILIEYLAGSATPTPLEKTVVFLARQDLQFGRHRLAAMRICGALLHPGHSSISNSSSDWLSMNGNPCFEARTFTGS